MAKELKTLQLGGASKAGLFFADIKHPDHTYLHSGTIETATLELDGRIGKFSSFTRDLVLVMEIGQSEQDWLKDIYLGDNFEYNDEGLITGFQSYNITSFLRSGDITIDVLFGENGKPILPEVQSLLKDVRVIWLDYAQAENPNGGFYYDTFGPVIIPDGLDNEGLKGAYVRLVSDFEKNRFHYGRYTKCVKAIWSSEGPEGPAKAVKPVAFTPIKEKKGIPF